MRFSNDSQLAINNSTSGNLIAFHINAGHHTGIRWICLIIMSPHHGGGRGDILFYLVRIPSASA